MLFVDAGNDRVAVGTATPLAPLHIVDSGAGDVLIIESTDAGATAAPDIVFYRNSASAATGDVLGRVEFRGRNAANNADISWAVIEATAEDATGAGEDGRITFKVARQGHETEYLQLGGIVGSQRTIVFNDSGSDIDFRIEGASAPNALFVEGSSGNVGIGTAAPATTLHLASATSGKPALTLENTASVASAANEPEIIFLRSGDSDSSTSGDLGRIMFKGLDSADNLHTYLEITGEAVDESTGTEDGRIRVIMTRAGADNTEFLRMSGSEGVVFNSDGIDNNFRIESDDNVNMFVVDGGVDRVGVGLLDPLAMFEVAGANKSRQGFSVADPGASTLTAVAHAGAYIIESGNVTINLPSTSTIGEQYCFIATHSSGLTIGRNGKTINGATSNITVAQYKAKTAIAIGSNNWVVIG